MAEITWIKLKTDMFDDEKIKLIERMPEGDGILIIWVKLLAYAGKVNCSGYIMIAEDIPMNIEEMAIIFNRPLEKVRYAVQVLQRYKMIEVDENERICISNWEKHQNIDGMEHVKKLNAARQKKHREKQKLAQLPQPNEESNVTHNVTGDDEVTSRNATDIEVEVDIEEDIELKRSTTATTNRSREVFAAVQNNIRFNLSPIEIETIEYWLKDYPHELILEAVKRAALSNKTTVRYVESILKDWQKKRITTLAEVERDDAAFKQQKGGKRYESNSRNVPQHRGEEPDDFSL